MLEDRYLRAFESMVCLPMNDAVFLRAAALRARFPLRTPYAPHLACAQIHDCSMLLTNDDRLARAGHGLAQAL